MAETTRKSILSDAEKCVCGTREQSYGSPENNFQVIAEFWRVYIMAKYGIDVPFAPDDSGIMLSLLKIARIASGQSKDDNYIDLAGYAACAGEIACKATAYKTEAVEPITDKPSKWEGLSNDELRARTCQAPCCHSCIIPSTSNGKGGGLNCVKWIEANPEEARTLMTDFLDGKENNTSDWGDAE